VGALDLHGTNPNVHLTISDLSRAMVTDVDDRLVDLLEIATYVFAADQAVNRGSNVDTGAKWRRNFDLHIAVRDRTFWAAPELRAALIDLLSFLSDDDYSLTFTELGDPPGVQQYLELGDEWRAKIERVQLFSGGADSFAGAVRTAIQEKKNVALVCHRSAPKRAAKTKALLDEIAARATPVQVQPVGIWATKTESVGHEYTQRTRSFLYAAMAATVASLAGLDRFFFFENGITSLNLPISGQVVGARSTRTTHPQVIRGFARVFSLVLARSFEVETPFLWSTKGEIMKIARDGGCGDLLAHTVSCSRTVEATALHPHCGRCSQCIDRRFAAMAVGLTADEDPPEMYAVDLLKGERRPGEDRAMIEGFVERARFAEASSDVEFLARFPEATRVLRHTGLSADEAARRVLDLHRRHSQEVGDVLERGFKENARALQVGEVPDSCLLVLSLPKRYREGAGQQDAESGPTFLREGDFWLVSYGNETSRFKNTLGMRYIALLLQSPGHEYHAAELIRMESGAMSLPSWVAKGGRLEGADGEPAGAPPKDTIVDRRGVREYERRLAELAGEISEAMSSGDTEQKLILEEEEKAIRKNLSAIFGLEGAPRAFAEEAERARKSVAAALRRTRQHIARKKHLLLARHLQKALKVGMYCEYRPDPPVVWTVRL
jgi:hypothetical protein